MVDAPKVSLEVAERQQLTFVRRWVQSLVVELREVLQRLRELESVPLDFICQFLKAQLHVLFRDFAALSEMLRARLPRSQYKVTGGRLLLRVELLLLQQHDQVAPWNQADDFPLAVHHGESMMLGAPKHLAYAADLLNALHRYWGALHNFESSLVSQILRYVVRDDWHLFTAARSHIEGPCEQATDLVGDRDCDDHGNK